MNKINKELLSKITILYVEDEVSISEQVKYFFSKYVKNFYTAQNGIEGLKLFKEVEPDILITDIQMPKMNGLEMIRELDNKRQIPIIITTAYSDAEYFLKAIELKVDKFVIKPVNLVELISDVQRLFIEDHLQGELYEKDVLLNILNKNVLISVTNTDGKLLDVSDAFCELTGYTKSELIGKDFSIIKHKDTKDEFYEDVWERASYGKKVFYEVKNVDKNGKEFWSNVTITPIFNGNEIIKYIAIREDITNKKKLEVIVIEDELTKTYNRRHFNKVIDSEIRRVKRENLTLSLLCLDIDYFKKYNDAFGHLEGDKILIEVANSLKSNLLRATDYLFRIGGEEFCILFSGMNIQESMSFSIEIIKNVEKLGIKQIDGSNVTMSAGLIVQEGFNIAEAMDFYKYGDNALYEAKDKGRNQVFLSEHSKDSLTK